MVDGLTMQQAGTALRSLGLAEELAAASLTSNAHYSYDAITGQLLGSHGAAPRAAEATASPRAEATPSSVELPSTTGSVQAYKRNAHLPRTKLRALLHSKLEPGTVRWGHRFRDARVLADATMADMAAAAPHATAHDGATDDSGTAPDDRRVLTTLEPRRHQISVETLVPASFSSRLSPHLRKHTRPSASTSDRGWSKHPTQGFVMPASR